MQQFIAVRLRLSQRIEICVAAHEKRRNRRRQRLAQPRNRFDASLAVAQVIIGDNHVGRLVVVCQYVENGPIGAAGHDAAPPTADQAAHALEYKRIVIDDDDESLVEPGRIRSHRSPRLGGGIGRGTNERHSDAEARALTKLRFQIDRMFEETAQPIDDGKTKPETAGVLIGYFKAVELAENLLMLVVRDADARVPDLDAQPIRPPAAADQHAAGRRIADCVRYEVEHDPLQEDEVAAHP